VTRFPAVARLTPGLIRRRSQGITARTGETILRNTVTARQAGVPLAVGSDQPVGVGTHIEMELMAEAGLTPAEVLIAASAGGARVLGLEGEVGTIVVGKRADLVVLRSNPLSDIRNARDVEWTIKGGQQFQDGERVTPRGY
jgi:imidazolonepropionase-like amidohydrolase